jgi:YfiH family protein
MQHVFANQVLVPQWPAPAGVHALTTLRGPAGYSAPPFNGLNLGARCGDRDDCVHDNRALLRAQAVLPSAPCWLQQVHGTAVHRFGADAPSTYVEPQADAAVTAMPGQVLAILTADCLPVTFTAVDGSEVAIAHAGWRGLCDGVLEATLQAMDAAPENVMAWLGPAAGPRRYEVGDDVRDAFIACDRDAEHAFRASRPRHWLCDLYQLARQRLRAQGVHRIYGGEYCTIDDAERFFSHRRDGRSGRMASLIWIAAER